MNRVFLLVAAIGFAMSGAVLASDNGNDQAAAMANDSDVKTLPQVDSTDKNHNSNSLSSTLERGMDNKGLTMEEKWSDDVIVCKRQKMSGSRVTRKVCHSRGEWRAMRENGREVAREATRRDAGPKGN